MVDILQTAFSNSFHWIQAVVVWIETSLCVCFPGPIDNNSTLTLLMLIENETEILLKTNERHPISCLGSSVENGLHKIFTKGANWLLVMQSASEINNPLWHAPVAYLGAFLITIHLNTLKPRQNGRDFADDIFKCIFLNEDVWIPLELSLKFVHKVRINNILALVQIMAWHRRGDKPLSDPRMFSLPTHICVTRSQWVNINLITARTAATWINGKM